ncbi:MAG TPA: C1 family peptidase [Kiritimatiellia bacterium]|nr:C1 family peptidase [Kiritimatiellia bacterium]HMO99630.1 C1 family peptidase [Kiritimatiellia bacterium]HMP97123.1 C1 family peptidase [Kiritimatiellia bacterium]
MKTKPFSQRGGGLSLAPPVNEPDHFGMGSGPDESWIPRCIVGDDQGQDGACVIFSLASWSEIITGRAISNSTCQQVYRQALAALGRPLGSGMSFQDGFRLAPRAWFPGRTKIVRANLDNIGEQPLLGGYNVTPAFDKTNAAGCLNHRAAGNSRGAHAVVIVARGTLPGKTGRWVWIENSWGTRWGWKGLGVMNETLQGRLCREIWRIV